MGSKMSGPDGCAIAGRAAVRLLDPRRNTRPNSPQSSMPDGIVRSRRVDLQRVIKARFRFDYCERYVWTPLKKLGFAHVSAPALSRLGRRDRRGFQELSHEPCAPNRMACPRTSPSKSGFHANIVPRGEYLAVSTRQLAIEQRDSKPRSHQRRRLQGLEQTHRAGRYVLINRNPRSGACGSIPMTVGIRSRKEKSSDGTA
jgi:hypothetical protein